MLAAGGADLRSAYVAVDTTKAQQRLRRRIFVVLNLAVLACASSFNAPARADPNALWRIVHGECVPHMEAGLGPKPCERVDLDGGVEQGVAILKDLVGVSQMLAIPTRRITGIEDPQMLAPNAPPVFAVAWAAKNLVEARLWRGVARGARWTGDQLEMDPQSGTIACPCRLHGRVRREGPRRIRFGARRRLARDDRAAP